MMEPTTHGELHSAGIDASNPMNSERRVGEPGQWRVGNDLVARRRNGGLIFMAGFFHPSNADARAQWQRVLDNMREPVEA